MRVATTRASNGIASAAKTTRAICQVARLGLISPEAASPKWLAVSRGGGGGGGNGEGGGSDEGEVARGGGDLGNSVVDAKGSSGGKTTEAAEGNITEGDAAEGVAAWGDAAKGDVAEGGGGGADGSGVDGDSADGSDDEGVCDRGGREGGWGWSVRVEGEGGGRGWKARPAKGVFTEADVAEGGDSGVEDECDRGASEGG